jgi:acyl carrier protein
VAIRTNPKALRSLAQAGLVPSLLSGLIRVPQRRAAAAGALLAKLAALPEAERPQALLELVSAEVAAVLGHDSAAAIDPDRAFQELGFDSLAAVELRNRLAAATGMALAPTLVFDYPNAEKLAEHLLSEFEPTTDRESELESRELEVRDALLSIPLTSLRRAGLMDPLMRLARGDDGSEGAPIEADSHIEEMDVEELIRMSADSDGSSESSGGLA